MSSLDGADTIAPSQPPQGKSVTRGRPSRLAKHVFGLLQDELKGLQEGTGLLPETELAEKFGVSRKTIRAAMRQLVNQGVVERVRGKGTFPTRGTQARALFRAQAIELGTVSFGGTAGFYSAILEGILHESMHRNSQIVLSGGPTHEELAEACFRLSDDQRIRGLIVIALTDQKLLDDLARRGKPICLVDHFTERAKVDCVRVDSNTGSQLAVEHLYSLGHRRIAYINITQPQTNMARFLGYKAKLAERKLEFRNDWVIEADGVAGGAQAALRFISMPVNQRPTAILAFNEEQALGAAQAIIRFGMRVPEDFSIIGTGGSRSPLTVGLPDLTCVRYDPAELGRLAVRHLMDRMEKPSLPARNVMIPGVLHLAQTTAPVR